MIEMLLEAERALTVGRLDEADRLFRQVADRDPRSAIAIVGLARVALERGDDLGAYLNGRRALAIDPENPTARHLVMRTTEILAGRGEAPPAVAPPAVAPPSAAPEGPPMPEAEPERDRRPEPVAEPPPGTPVSAPTPDATARRKPGIIGRILGRRRP